MKDWTTIRERYLRDNLPVRLGGLAANLSRIKSFAAQDANRDVVESALPSYVHLPNAKYLRTIKNPQIL